MCVWGGGEGGGGALYVLPLWDAGTNALILLVRHGQFFSGNYDLIFSII